MISLPSSAIFDLAFRFATVGLLLMMMVLNIKNPAPVVKRTAVLLLLTCVSAYLLLTLPIEDEYYGWLRQPLLLFTDLTAFAILFYVQTQLQPKWHWRDSPFWISAPILGWCVFLAWFFLFTPGSGLIHDISHVVGMAVLLWVVYRCISGYQDDLVDKRRQMRLKLSIGIGSYMALLTLFELFLHQIRNTAAFGMVNAMIMFVLVFWVILRNIHLTAEQPVDKPKKAANSNNPQLAKLEEFMQQGGFREEQLSIGKLAEHINMPEHQLRKLINQQLGFSNFSHYLNSYRIPAMCEKLKSADKSLPILTLALDMGYGSVATFNRAFKQQIGVTPTEYRDQF
ncbi:helix-turn-helix domain-containing protein [Neptunicella marina]|uniref:Helix-turn-helix transcriptional regulator n=1 Tax=Neptunicella marina TaxID=2125989 RepID=A0A8J6IRQ9_9ALTE|nr:AraC family transcriptional regulator [Neptunicella marina]MBC3764642.1 helix-turn-helix transcriptional regulator [Neptunicella marina]